MKTLARPDCRTELSRRLRSLRPDSERRWGVMTAPQMVCHLADACRMALGQMRVSDDSTLVKRTLIKWLALYVPLRWRPGIVTRPEIDQQVTGTAPSDFAADVAEALTLLNAIADHADAAWPRHPVFGTLSSSEWLRWAYLHTDHHLRQFGV